MIKNLQSKYNRLTLNEKTLTSVTKNKRKTWFITATCDCGIKKTVRLEDVVSGKTKSCGCLFMELSAKRITDLNKQLFYTKQYGGYRHGDYGSRFHTIYRGMVQRCTYKKSQKYPTYGGRGIKIIWDSYSSFKKDMYTSYLKHVDKYGIANTTIDRIDNDGNYCKENCKWSTVLEQMNNTSKNKFLTKDGETLTVSQWARKLNIKRSTISNRIHKLKLSDVNEILKVK